MVHETLVDTAILAAHLNDPQWRLIDCRFSLGDRDAGRRAFTERTIPGAIYAHLDDDLSGPVVPGLTGRHPLPRDGAWEATLGRWGIGSHTQVVAFDDAGGAFAARLWWMLRWVGHRAVAVLDGGLGAYEAAGYAFVPGSTTEYATHFESGASLVESIDVHGVYSSLSDRSVVLMDARHPTRFRGESEETDPVAGHIKGARSVPFVENLDEAGHFRSTVELRARFVQRLAGAEPKSAVMYCGSGVTACHNILAMAHAEFELPRLYPGSWSEWILDPQRPRAIGDEQSGAPGKIRREDR